MNASAARNLCKGSIPALMAAAIWSATIHPAVASCDTSYRVQPGDTLSRIASKCGVNVRTLMQLNSDLTNPNHLVVGQNLSTRPGSRATDGLAQQNSSGAGQPGGITNIDHVFSIDGMVLNGRLCALLKTSEGETLGLTGFGHGFRNESRIRVSGTIRDNDPCGHGMTISVLEKTVLE